MTERKEDNKRIKGKGNKRIKEKKIIVEEEFEMYEGHISFYLVVNTVKVKVINTVVTVLGYNTGGLG